MKKDKKIDLFENPNKLSLKNEIIGLVLFFLAIFFVFSLVSYAPSDPSFFNSTSDHTVRNYGGLFGAQIAAFLFNLFGYSAYICLFYMLFMTGFYLLNKKIPNVVTKSLGYLMLLLSFSSFIAGVKSTITIGKIPVRSGGIIGFFINEFFKSQLKQFFAALLFAIFVIIALILITKFSLRKIIGFFFGTVYRLWNATTASFKQRREEKQKNKSLKKVQQKYNVDASPSIPNKVEVSKADDDDDDIVLRPAHRFQIEEEEVAEEEPDIFDLERTAPAFEKEKSQKLEKPEKVKKQVIRQPSRLPEETSLFSDFGEEAAEPTQYKTPPLSYLDAPTQKSQIDYKELEYKKEELKQRLVEFKIRGEIAEYTPGPVITTYEFVPDTGVKVKDVTNLAEDLALVAKAQYVRIERILGKKAIGIEIPNKKRETIHLREVLESEDYKNSRSPLTIGIGKTKSGEIFISDLREMPHLIIAGATGSGKSVAIHSILLSILYKASPDEVKLVMIDPKRVELALYNTLPHLLTPVVVNTKLAKNSLEWAVFEMENRYKKLALLQARNLDQYNKKLQLMKQTEDEGLDKLEDTEHIPYIVIVIDEFADLMMESQREIENAVARIAQKARAVGIHLILATQRPSIDVITGTIKNNFPSRIALAVPSKHDSRTIIDVMGAEKLLGNGDMLFLPPKTATLVRLHCAYVSEDEILRVVTYLSKMGRPKFNSQVIKPIAGEAGEGEDMDLDELFFEAAETVINTGQASASYLQRKMSIGYARAGRLIDQLQRHGVVSASDSKNKREILMNLDEVYSMKGGGKSGSSASDRLDAERDNNDNIFD
ncbi:MAG: DNA translocase FtsK [Candidatus Omnitrophota bacterium]